MKMRWILTLALLVGGGSVAAVALRPRSGQLRAAIGWTMARSRVAPRAASKPAPDSPGLAPERPEAVWDQSVRITPEQGAALGLQCVEVTPQTEPTTLQINGTTAYNPSTLTRIRSRFKCLVSKVYPSLGQEVKKGEPLVELFSTDLAEAKGLYEERYAQWEHDRAQYERVKPLYDQRAISEKDYYDALNDERKSRLEYKVARDNLIVFGLSEQEIENLPNEDGSKKAHMTLRSPADGLVIERAVVVGNLYDENDVMMVIAPMDRLWVVGNVYESDQMKVRVGQRWDITFPFGSGTIHAAVERVDTRVDPVTKTIQIRTTIENPGGRLKADMLVHSTLEVPPVAGHTVVPRVAVVVADDNSYVFVRDPEHPDRFRRRQVQIAEESHDRVIIARGLGPGDRVVSRGSLIVSQMYEDESIAATGAPR